MAGTKVLVIGLDGADKDFVTRGCDAGLLPTLASLRERGALGVLRSPPGLGDDAVWSSFATSLTVGNHGRYHHRQLSPGSYDVTPFRDARGALFWEALCRAGRSVAILDVPKCRLASDPSAVQVRDWRVHGRDGPTASVPGELAESLIERFGEDETDRSNDFLCGLDALSPDLHGTFVERLLRSVRQKEAAACELLQSRDWDLFLVVFKEAHCAGHQLWPRACGAVRQDAPAFGDDGLSRVHRALDGAIERLLVEAGPNADVIVFSPLGMDANVTGEHLLDAILLRLDDALPVRAWRRLQQRGEKSSSRSLHRLTRALRPRLHGHRTAFPLEHNEISGAIRINVRGRDPRGHVRPGKNFARVLDRLSEDLMAIVDPDSSVSLVESVLRSDGLFAGERRDALPDLFVLWNRGHGIGGAKSPKIGELRMAAPAWRSGNHVPGGFLIAAGPSVARTRDALEVSVVDLGPTIAALLSVSLADVDGRPVPLRGP